MQQLRLDAENAEDQGEHGAAKIEKQLPGIDDAAGEIIKMRPDIRVVHGRFNRIQHITIEPRRLR